MIGGRTALSHVFQVTFLKTELESKIKQLKGLQADMKSMHVEADSKLDACEVW